MLSGYLITNVLLRDAERLCFRPMQRRFYMRRAARILPAYALALVCLYPLVGADLRRYWVYYLLFLQDVPYAFHWIGLSALWPLWSLAVEQQFYLMWPVVVYFLPRRWLAPCLVCIVALSPVLRWMCTPLFPYPEVIYASTPFRLDGMALGGLVALWLPGCRRGPVVQWAQVSIVAGVVVYGVLSLHPWFRRGANSSVFNSLGYSLDLMVLGGFFVWAAAAEGGVLTAFLSHPLMRVDWGGSATCFICCTWGC